MEEYFGTFDVLEKFYAEALASRGAFDEAGDVGDDKPIVCAQIGLKRGEGVIGHAALGSSKLIEQARFASIGQADEPYVGDEAELETKIRHVAHFPLFGFHWCGIDGGAKFEIAAATLASACCEDALPRPRNFLHIASIKIGDGRARWDFQHQIFSRAAVDELSATILAVFGMHFLAARIVHQSPDIGHAFEVDIAAPAAVSAGRALHKFHLLKSHGTLAAVAAAQPYCYFVYQHIRMLSLVRTYGNRAFRCRTAQNFAQCTNSTLHSILFVLLELHQFP